eukprot:5580245-Amphidinium_carterae.1
MSLSNAVLCKDGVDYRRAKCCLTTQEVHQLSNAVPCILAMGQTAEKMDILQKRKWADKYC